MNNPPQRQSPKLKELQALWYAKLKQAGFDDIENGEEYLNEWDSCYFQQRYTPDAFEARQEYYLQAEHFFHSTAFDALARSSVEREIWRLHSQGFGFRGISKELAAKEIRFNKDKVALVVNRLKASMKVAARGDLEPIVDKRGQYCFPFMSQPLK